MTNGSEPGIVINKTPILTPMAALSRPRSSRSTSRRRLSLWFERLIALIALANLLLVCFDASYIRFRDLYLKTNPEFTWWYGETFKGIEPERATTAYLITVAQLEEQVAQTGLQSSQADFLLDQLRQQSIEIIDQNPFEIADKSGTLERLCLLSRPDSSHLPSNPVAEGDIASRFHRLLTLLQAG